MTAKPQVRIYEREKSIYEASKLSNLNPIFRVLDFHCRIAQVKIQFQTRNTEIIDSKTLINTYCCIGHERLELKSFLVAHFLLNTHNSNVCQMR